MTHRQSGLEMPNDLIFIRHGESEANVIQDLERKGEIHDLHREISSRADWEQRLTKLGTIQAESVGAWLDDVMGGIRSFDGCFVSPFMRARETASHIGGDDWIIDDRITERFRGVYGVESFSRAINEDALAELKTSPWYARVDGSESMQDVFHRYRTFQDSLRRNHAGQRVIAVAHGDFIKAARYAIEWLLPETWMSEEKIAELRLPNGGIVHYTRVNPFNPMEVSHSIKWRRVIFPLDIANSPFKGSWQELDIKRRYTSKELKKTVDKVKPLLSDIDIETPSKVKK